MANIVDPDQTAPKGAVSSGSTVCSGIAYSVGHDQTVPKGAV